jgi:L-ascorbate metabolism protein UlaG (beta-lactamase superfamily)
MKRLRRILLGVLVLLLAGIATVVARANLRPSLEPYRELVRTKPAGTPSGFTVTFLGVSTLLFDDGETAVMTDGFFSRPGKLEMLFGKVAPDRGAVDRALARAKIKRLAAVIPLHSHYDHALDAPLVAQRTGALLVGTASSANIARGQGLPEDRIVAARPGDVLKLGAFTIRFFASKHAPSRTPYEGEITHPLTVPADVGAFREGGCLTLWIRRGDRSVLVQGSAGWIDGALAGVHADVVYLGIGLLGKQDADYRQRYWNALVRDTGAQRVIPIHWDDFWRPLDEPLVALPRLADDVDVSMDFLVERAYREHVDLELPQAWLAADPYAGQ